MSPPKVDEELPVLEALTLPIQVKGKGWVVFALKVQGMKVLEAEPMGEPENQQQYALERLKIEFARRALTSRSRQ